MQAKYNGSMDADATAEQISDKNEDGLDAVLLSEQPQNFSPPDELLEGILTIGDSSVIYGDSNSGKTFLAIDMACAIARGANWMGRRTDPGLVIYLAAESPGSVLRRLQTYQQYHHVVVPNFVIVRSPVNLFDGDADTNAVIKLVEKFEDKTGQKTRLIVGDTLARVMTGGNESSSQDMGVVVRHIDIIRAHTHAHFNLIHHSGKNAFSGARGSNSLRCAIDTEIEITDSIDGRCAEIKKQRDLATKGERIGFRLETVTMGVTKWNKPATSCVVLSWDAPIKKPKLLSGAAAAVDEYMRSCDQGIHKKVCKAHFSGRYHATTVGRVLDSFVEEGRCTELMGYYTKVDEKWS